MLHAFIFGPIAVTAGHWVQRGVDTESGARVEIRRVEHEEIPGAPAGVAGLRLLPVSAGIWRADLFRDQDGHVIYHYHPHFEKGDVGERLFDVQLTADPVGFVIDRLRDLRTVLETSGAGDVVDQVDYAEVERALPAIRAAIAGSFEPATTLVPAESQVRESDLSVLRELVDEGNEEAERRLTELAVQRGDIDELRRLADEGNEEAERRLTELIRDMK